MARLTERYADEIGAVGHAAEIVSPVTCNCSTEPLPAPPFTL